MDKGVKAVLYKRISSERQAEKGLSIPAQLRELRAYCAKHGYLVGKEFTDAGYSKTTDQRPGLQEMIAFCRLHHDELDAALVWAYSRFSRDRVHAAVYKRILGGGWVLRHTDSASDPTGRTGEAACASDKTGK